MKSRREFIKETGIVVSYCCSVGVLSGLEGCAAPRYVNYVEKPDSLIVKKSEFQEDKYVLLNYEKYGKPIFLLKKSSSNYIALLLLCTHKACKVKPGGSILICPCHGSQFSHEGKVLKGPAEKDLFAFKVSADNENIYIQIKRD